MEASSKDSENKPKASTALELTLDASLECAQLVAVIDEVLFALSQKRSTLEEKSISSYLHKLTVEYGHSLAFLHAKPQDMSLEAGAWLSALKSLRSINEKVSNSVHELLKIIRFNLNFLEQYFEYDYAFNLTQNSGFLEELQRVNIELAKGPL